MPKIARFWKKPIAESGVSERISWEWEGINDFIFTAQAYEKTPLISSFSKESGKQKT
ncbi:hypothetical protein MUO65_00100 [bacterium]|nr:hypothetical protein [bacterium]